LFEQGGRNSQGHHDREVRVDDDVGAGAASESLGPAAGQPADASPSFAFSVAIFKGKFK
jgi:hypothetical protein